MRLELAGIRVVLDRTVIVDDVTITVGPGTVVGVVGPNGSGKSSLLRTVYRHLAPTAGAVLLDDVDLTTLKPIHAARRVAALPQESPPDTAVNVEDVVALGRVPHKRPFAPDTATDRNAITTALRRAGVEALRARRFTTLSGGEKQRVLLARALAQQCPVLVMDEPTNHLDVAHQFALLELIRSLRLTTLVALHDLNLAAAYCDQLYVLAAGHLAAHGPPDEVLTPSLLAEVFRINAQILPDPSTGKVRLLLSPLLDSLISTATPTPGPTISEPVGAGSDHRSSGPRDQA